jgi:carboxypeptidase D
LGAGEGASLPRTVKSFLDPGASLSFKETHICETTPGVKSYSGYVNLPANPAEGRVYDIHTFFWFFEARKDPAHAPLSLWLQGGPGSPSTPAAIGENGPCRIKPDSKGTVLNPWSWNNEVNMLYMDQPVQTGFSYDKLVNGTIDETIRPYLITPVSSSSPAPELNSTTLLGVFPSQSTLSSANTTSTAALAAWQFMQIWMKE